VTRRIVCVLAGMLLCAGWAVPSARAGQQSTTRLVTFAVRTCPAYGDVTANRARNNLMESLENLGADSTYNGVHAVNPVTEDAEQPNCTPLPNWRLTMGTAIAGSPVKGPWGSLSIVANPFDTDVVTQAGTPLLDRNGTDTGETISGAVTIRLTDAQIQQASKSSLWVQGGTPTDPVLRNQFPGPGLPPTYGYAALRCALDALNGDNVEYVSYPSGAKHVFCYAYYVVPPPTSGTIIVRKVVDDPAATAGTAFTFQGDISFTADEKFGLTAGYGKPASQTFYRAGGRTWSWKDLGLPGWQHVGLSCTSQLGSVATTDLATGTVSVTLRARDTVTCTHTNRPAPPPGQLLLSKRTIREVGSFGFDVDGPQQASQTTTTTEPLTAVAGAPLSLQAGDYAITETTPAAGPAGSWHLARVNCDGTSVDLGPPVIATVAAGKGTSCIFTNEFTYGGSIVLRKRTEGAAGSASFIIRPIADRARSYEQSATTEGPGQTATATGDATSAIPLGRYEIVETGPAPIAGGSWKLESVICDGLPTAAAQGRIVVTLGEADPSADCSFVNRFTKTPEPVNPTNEPTTPDGGEVTGAGDVGPFADLSVTKRVSPTTVRQGGRVRFRIVVENNGPNTAYDVVASELNPHDRRTLDLHTSQGTCRGTRPARCAIGALQPGEGATMTVDVMARRLGRRRNVVAVASTTDDPNLADNRDSAVVRVLPPTGPRFTG
jgi:uncharacterized repeat protein (TIGR01451 family)